MPFPVSPSSNENEELFYVEDPFGLRVTIFPLWNFTPNTQSIIGLGTGFRLDPLGNALTAFHVLENHIELTPEASNPIGIAEHSKPLGLDSMGIVYGAPVLKPIHWMQFKTLETHCGYEQDPYIAKGPINTSELIAFNIPSRKPQSNEHKWLPADFSGNIEVGDKVLALGFPKLKPDTEFSEVEILEISAYMAGSIRTVTEIKPEGVGPTRPWPTLIVDGDWPAGMSGGPVFNQAGHVIGVVSTGSPGQYATARWFGGDNMTESLFPHIDPLNPGCFLK